MAGVSLAEQGCTEEVVPGNFAVKESVFPFVKFPGVDPLLGPEMKSTGEVMGVGTSFGVAFAKAQLAAGVDLPRKGRVFLSVRERDRDHAVELGRELAELGFSIISTKGTGMALQRAGVECGLVNKVYDRRKAVDCGFLHDTCFCAAAKSQLYDNHCRRACNRSGAGQAR